MLITSDFAFVHLSKTGGTFAEQTICEILCRSRLGRRLHRYRKKYHLRVPFFRYRYLEEGDQHALCVDIPAAHRSKPIVSCIRNPFDLYVSEYTFKWWITYADQWFDDLDEVNRSHPNWKNASFPEFYALSNRHASWVQRTLRKHPAAAALGWYSHKFVYYFCRDHDYAFAVADDPDRFCERVKETMFPVHFIHTERLNRELHQFLLSHGYPAPAIQHILDKEKVNTSRSDHNWRRWYSPEMEAEVRRRDDLLFRLFPEYGRSLCDVQR